MGQPKSCYQTNQMEMLLFFLIQRTILCQGYLLLLNTNYYNIFKTQVIASVNNRGNFASQKLNFMKA